ncbi:hypothetical protein [Streptomyces sp. NBC_01767]|uniref:hypothetical protein n=1 Tax=unclassified Streptomyces TaxID=2593676 RepID=UPI00225170CF|nr:hypothetical protein [Streptomyces sp. NBC_01767]MCX4396332.1 hypothetical protein [Streptomyces sp. NBC_01767]WSG51112.1 hypothetical protein OHA38_15630 [Streptomyces sp. NBC_01732]
MAWDEWEQIKSEVTDRQSVAMRINHVPMEPPTGPSAVTGGLKSNKKAWVTAGEGVGSLRRSIGAALTQLEEGQAGIGTATGCLSMAAQKDVYNSWKKYAERVSERCGALQKILEQVGHDLLSTDDAVEGEMQKLNLKYADTDAIGGRAKGQ